jgi:hypothetical protein
MISRTGRRMTSSVTPACVAKLRDHARHTNSQWQLRQRTESLNSLHLLDPLATGDAYWAECSDVTNRRATGDQLQATFSKRGAHTGKLG